jgi:hypothetical protein
MAKRTINPDELRNRFRAASRVPQLLEVRDMVRVSMRQTSDEMDRARAATAWPSCRACSRN